MTGEITQHKTGCIIFLKSSFFSSIFLEKMSQGTCAYADSISALLTGKTGAHWSSNFEKAGRPPAFSLHSAILQEIPYSHLHLLAREQQSQNQPPKVVARRLLAVFTIHPSTHLPPRPPPPLLMTKLFGLPEVTSSAFFTPLLTRTEACDICGRYVLLILF